MRGAHLISATGSFNVHCQVCGLKYDVVDSDGRSGYAKVDLTWGPNTYQGKFNEAIIRGYAIFQVDADRGQSCSPGSDQHSDDLKHVDLNNSLVEIPKRSNQSQAADGSEKGCGACPNVYSTTVNWQMPSGVTAVRLMVSPVTDAGEVLPLGLTTGIVTDVTVPPTQAPMPAPTTATSPKGRIVGKIVMKVANVIAFINDSKVNQGMQNSIASMAKVLPSYVKVTLSAARRLRGPHDEADGRRLQAGKVNVDFTIDIPAGATVSASAVQSNIAKVEPAAFKAIVNKELQKLGSNQVIEEVKNIEAMEVAVVPPGGSSRVIATDDDDNDDGRRIAGIVVGVLVGVCCIVTVVGASVWCYKKQQPGRQEVEVEPCAAAVIPQQQQPWKSPVIQVSSSQAAVIPGVPSGSD